MMSSERKINLVYNKFVSNNSATNISKKEFYNKLKDQTKVKSVSDLCVYLTNGTNKKLNNDGDGTTAAFKTLSDDKVGDLFDVTHATTVFDSSLKKFGDKSKIEATIKDSAQVWKNASKYDRMYAGSVIRVNVAGSNPAFPVCGGYHINGIEINIVSDKKNVETDSVGLVKAYYTAIMDDFFTLAMATPSSSGTSSGKHHVLHLAQIPGNLYGGTEITGNAFHTAVTDWIASKTNGIPPLSMSMTISIDFEEHPSHLPGPATLTAATDVSKEKVAALRVRLDSAKVKLAETEDTDKNAAFSIAEEIFNAFFGDGADKSKQTKPFLTDKVAELATMSIFCKEPIKSKLDGITTRLENPAAATTSTSTVGHMIKPAIKPVKKYVFAFDIDDTLVRSGRLNEPLTDGSRHKPFTPSTDATEYEAMLKLMKAIIDAGHYVWIVTANTSISKATFDTNYLKSDTKIRDSPNYYFMNPTTVNDLKAQFDKTKISPYLTNTTSLDLSFVLGAEFQSKGLKPYAMIAKWLQLGNPNMNDVKMYLFDDNTIYEPTCTKVKDNKIEFVKITPVDVSANFKSDVLTKAIKIFEKIKTTTTTTTPVTSGGGKLNVMTFNTWYHTFNATENAAVCNDNGKSDNECVKNNRNAVLAQMDKPGPVVIFLQEFSYDFDKFIGPEVSILPNKFESRYNAAKGSPIKAFRHFEITYNTRKFYVYIGQIVQSVMATIYSSDLVDNSATEFFMGNLASGMNPGGNINNHEIVPTFSGNNAKLKTDEWITYDFRGGNRPFTILRFDTADLKLILLNIHSPHPYVFGDLHDGNPPKPDPGAPKSPITVAEFAFNALGPFFTKHVFTSGIDKKDYTFVAGGDFNADAATAIGRLKPIFHDIDPAINRKNLTCCVDAPSKEFDSTVDHIFSTSVISDYTVHNVETLVKSKSGMNYFSDHLPVYATITLPSVAPVATDDSGP